MNKQLDYIIFGAGKMCEELLGNLEPDTRISAIVDNDAQKQSRCINFNGTAIQVQKCDYIKNHVYDKIIIAAHNIYIKEMLSELIDIYNVESGNILLYDQNINDMFLYQNIGDIEIEDRSDTEILFNIVDYARSQKLILKNDLEKFFFLKDHRSIFKPLYYFEIYDRHFRKYRNMKIKILEIGVCDGGSLQMWKDYFGEDALIVGVDIDQRCKEFEEKNILIRIGSQSDRHFMRKLIEEFGEFDIVLDDGGHTMDQQIVTFEEIYGCISEGGIYMCEDLCTSYWQSYGGGYKKSDTFIEYSKNIIDYIHAWHSEENSLRINEYTKSIFALHYYDMILAIEKRKISYPNMGVRC